MEMKFKVELHAPMKEGITQNSVPTLHTHIHVSVINNEYEVV